MTRIFIEQTLAAYKLQLDMSARATVVGDWFIWFPTIFHSDIEKSLTEWFEVLNGRSNRNVIWDNWHADIDSWTTSLCRGFHGTFTYSCALTRVQENGALVHVVTHLPSGFIAARVIPIENGKVASFDIECALSSLSELLTYRKFPDPKLEAFRVAYTAWKIRGYTYLSTKTFLHQQAIHFQVHDLLEEIARWARPIDTMQIFRSSTVMHNYSAWRQLGSFIPGCCKTEYRDVLANRKLS